MIVFQLLYLSCKQLITIYFYEMAYHQLG
jgi:hypothetical protein